MDCRREPIKIPIPKLSLTVSGILDHPDSRPRAALTLAHGAGAGMEHAFLESLAKALTARGLLVLRFQFPYWERREKRPDSPDIATAAVAAAVSALAERAGGVPLFASGKSFGARMSTTAAARGLLGQISGIVCYGFPLHPAGEPGIDRARHLAEVPVPTLFLQGTRDALADWNLISKATAALPKAKLVEVTGADHSFHVLKRSGRTDAEILEQLVRETWQFVGA